MCPTENNWLADLREGGEEGFVCMYNCYYARLLAIAHHYTGSEETAQELVQEVFTKVWLQRSKLQVHTNLKAYLFSAIRNQVYDHLEKQAVREKHAVHARCTQAAGADTTSQQLAYEELQAQVQKQLRVLPAATRQVYRLSREEGLAIPKIAEQLQLSGKAVEYHLTKALKHLRLRLTHLLGWVLVFFFC
jgi:RNA polymerase sigma-70 factor (family 1)